MVYEYKCIITGSTGAFKMWAGVEFRPPGVDVLVKLLPNTKVTFWFLAGESLNTDLWPYVYVVPTSSNSVNCPTTTSVVKEEGDLFQLLGASLTYCKSIDMRTHTEITYRTMRDHWSHNRQSSFHECGVYIHEAWIVKYLNLQRNQ